MGKRAFFCVLFALMAGFTSAQMPLPEWQVGYSAPYLTNIGATIGAAWELKNGNEKVNLQLLLPLTYFVQPNVSNNFFFNPEVGYRWQVREGRFFLTPAVGLGYLLSMQRQDGVLNLATGTLDYRYVALHQYIPNANLSLGIAPKKHLGFFLKTTYGVVLSSQTSNTAFWGLSAGVLVNP